MATTRLQEFDGSLIESVCSRVRERLGAEEAPQAEEFVRQYYRRVPPEDLAQLEPLDLYGAALAHWSFARHRDPGTPKVRVYNPEFEQHRWQSGHTVVELVSDDMPFLVDSVTMALSGPGAGGVQTASAVGDCRPSLGTSKVRERAARFMAHLTSSGGRRRARARLRRPRRVRSRR